MPNVTIVPQIPALLLDDKKRYLIVSDVHIGFEAVLGANEIHMGKNTITQDIIQEIKQIISKTKPDSLILLGDTKSSVKTISKSEWRDVPIFFEELNKIIETTLIPGNHDGNIQRLVPDSTIMASPTGIIIGDALLTHGHAMPSENFAHIQKIIMGHIHPVFLQQDSVLNGQRVWLYIKAQKQSIFPSQSGTIDITVMPSFNKYLYATQKRRHSKSISPIIQRIKDESTARIVTLDGSIIGDESILDSVI